MTENHPGTQVEQPFRLDCFRNRLGDPKLLRRPPNECRVADRVRRRQQQQHARVIGKALQAPREAFLDAG